MRPILFLSIFIALNLNATNLAVLLETLESSSKLKSILEKSNSEIAQNELVSTYEAPLIGASLSHADSIPSDSKDGLEYSVSFSQDISHPFSSMEKYIGVNEYTKAIKQETKHQIHMFRLELVSAYHSTCVSRQMKEKSFLLYQEQSKRFNQLNRAYELGEISKKDLLFNKLDLAKLHQQVNSHKRTYITEFSSLQELVDNFVIEDVDCNDLIEPIRNIELNPIEEHGELKAIEYKKNAARAFYNVHNSAITSLGYELSYEKELDTRRYTLGFSIPLGGLSSKKESLKAEQYSLSSFYSHEKDSMQAQLQNYSKLTVSKLGVLYDEFSLLQNEILPLNKELVELSKSALMEGEGDIMEYLDSTRSYALNLLEMLEIKKSYYHELFELFKKADLDYGEKICKD